MIQTLNRLRLRAGMLFAVLAVALGSLGAIALPSTAVAKRKHITHHKTHKHSCIPQGNRGDNDPDNHGGPNDGDGCV